MYQPPERGLSDGLERLTPCGAAVTFGAVFLAPSGICPISADRGMRFMLADYAGVLVILVVGMVLVCAMLGLQMLLGPKREFAEKQEPFECGEKQIVSPFKRYAFKF